VKRNLTRLAGRIHDLLVVGGGIHGAWVAWDAALRGLSVALIERYDFGAATSANSLRMVHGGLRYLARGDLRRMRESIAERSALLRVAPRLVHPLPVMVPTRGWGAQSRLALGTALALNDMLSAGRNRGLGAAQQIPPGRMLTRAECLGLFPGFDGGDVTGGALWHDAQLQQPERLTLGLVQAATRRGAAGFNYIEAVEVLTHSGRVSGVRARDRVANAELEIHARAVVVAAGPWTANIVPRPRSIGTAPAPPGQAVALNVVLRRRFAATAVGVRAPSGAADDPVCGGHRFIFLVPDGDTTLLGTWYAVAGGGDLHATVERGAEFLVAELDRACPGLGVSTDDVVRYQWGRLPLKAGREPGRPDALADRPRITDHGGTHGIAHLFSVEGVKLTTSRSVAEAVVDRVMADLGVLDPGCRTATEEVVSAVPSSDVRRAVRDEFAICLADVVYRRTDIGAPPGPGRSAVAAAADLVAEELGWDAARREAEIEDVMRQARNLESPLEPIR
jgi:glycerol-3-phosphate dehydrogenase